jgi:hypothetical protein
MLNPQSTYSILVEMKQGQCNCPLSWSVQCNFTGEGKCNERGWACTPHRHQPGPPGLILPSSLNVRQKAAVATLCTLWLNQREGEVGSRREYRSQSWVKKYQYDLMYPRNWLSPVYKLCMLNWGKCR